MSKETNEYVDIIGRSFLDSLSTLEAGDGDPFTVVDIAFKTATINFLSLIAKELCDLNDKTPDGC